ncbi:MAG: RnfABCDGE type electron transport complex subunit B [Gammaproteobacteria bacterium]|nr:RnfABCDGE type electron transport complex subunit B [Gammaproteobacteria bacterium]
MNPDLDLADAIDRFLPQTQCAECGEPSCRAYAEAVAAGDAGIDRCPPGGAATVEALGRLLGRAPAAVDSPDSPAPRPPLRLALIREEACIGCKLCIAACPVDCIIGAAKLMHTVIAAQCSGCRLCLAVCPTDCIEMAAPPPGYATGAPSMWPEFSHAQVGEFRRRAQAKRQREADQQTRREQRAMKRRRDAMREEIRAAVERVRQRQSAAARQWVSPPGESPGNAPSKPPRNRPLNAPSISPQHSPSKPPTPSP